MTCCWCGACVPHRRRYVMGFRRVVITAEPFPVPGQARAAETIADDWLCPACVETLRKAMEERKEGRHEQLDESQDAEPQDLQGAHEPGAVVLQRPKPGEADGIDEIWDEIRFR